MASRDIADFSLTVSETLEISGERLNREFISGHGLSSSILNAYIQQLVIPEYEAGFIPWGVWIRVPYGQSRRERIKLLPEAVDWVVLARILQFSGLPQYYRIRKLFEVAIDDNHSITDLRRIRDDHLDLPSLTEAVRNERGIDFELF